MSYILVGRGVVFIRLELVFTGATKYL